MMRGLVVAYLLAGLAAPALARREFVATAEDFHCLTDGTPAPASTSTSSRASTGS